MRINCDLGEGCGNDAALMPLVDQASIACGGHAGDAETMRDTVRLAAEHDVEIGAHPSYPDRVGFGRRPMALAGPALQATLHEQVGMLMAIAGDAGVAVRYCKPHGALYHAMLTDAEVAGAVVDVTAAHGLALVVPAWRAALVDRLANAAGVVLRSEVFADRAYDDNGALLPRTQAGAVLPASAAAAQARELISGRLVTATGAVLPVAADTLCVHGDTPGAVVIATAVRQAVDDAASRA